MIITIDGPAAAGKGTLAGVLAQKYHLAYFDTGMVYRAVGLAMILQNFDLNDENQAEELAKSLDFPRMMELAKHPDFRSNTGGNAASIVSAYPRVRSALLKMQQNFACNPVFADGTPAQGAIYDGRDTGTVVCPQAEVKLFITASSEVRAQRRFKEFQQKGMDITFEKVLEDMIARDLRDSSRATAPLKPADDAIVFDTSDLSIEEVCTKAAEIVERTQKNA